MADQRLKGEFRFHSRSVRYAISGEGPPLVMVHGTPFSSFVWHRIAPWLARSFRVHIYDLLGYGESEKGFEGDVSLGMQNRLLVALLDHWDLDAPHVVGHDFGGATVLRTHLLNRREFASMTVINPVAMGPVGSPFVKATMRHKQAFQGLPAYIHDAIVTRYIAGSAHQPLRPDVLERLKAPWSDEAGQRAFYEQIAQMDQRYTDEVEPLYGEIRCPTLILWGREDAWIPFANGERLHAMIPHSAFLPVDGAGHLVPEDAPEAIVAGLLPFLQTHQAARPAHHA
jgi:pimeloyl-ACP methyl ester carboxylesterase